MKKFSINLKDPRLRFPILVTLLTAGGIYYWYSQVFNPLLKDQNDLKKQLAAKQDTLRIIQALKPQLAQLREELTAAQHRLDSLKSIFPDQKEIPKLIREITSVASAAGITTTKFTPLPDIEREYYVENRYSLAVEGGYHNLAEFFAFLANFTLIINLSSVNISGVVTESASSPPDIYSERQPTTVKATFEMTTFSSKR